MIGGLNPVELHGNPFDAALKEMKEEEENKSGIHQ